MRRLIAPTAIAWKENSGIPPPPPPVVELGALEVDEELVELLVEVLVEVVEVLDVLGVEVA
jgi:hypothetical protein